MWKQKIIDFLIAGAVTFAISALLVLGLGIFIPSPEKPSLNYDYRSCAVGDQSCLERINGENERIQRDYLGAKKIYDEKILIISAGIGLLFLLLGFIFLFRAKVKSNIAAGIIFAGAFAIFYGYFQGIPF